MKLLYASPSFARLPSFCTPAKCSWHPFPQLAPHCVRHSFLWSPVPLPLGPSPTNPYPFPAPACPFLPLFLVPFPFRCSFLRHDSQAVGGGHRGGHPPVPGAPKGSRLLCSERRNRSRSFLARLVYSKCALVLRTSSQTPERCYCYQLDAISHYYTGALARPRTAQDHAA